MAKPKIDELLIASALEPDLCRRLLESPDEVFQNYDLTVEERETLRRPDHRLLPMLGAALERQMKAAEVLADVPADVPRASSPCSGMAKMAMAQESMAQDSMAKLAMAHQALLHDTLMALTVAPCALHENGQFKGISYMMWVNPLPEGADPASLPAPAGMVLPGQPLTPLHAVIRISALQSSDAAGNPQLSLSGSFQHSTNVSPPPESSAEVTAAPFQSPINSAPVKAAAAAVRGSSNAERYDRLVDLLHTLHQGDVR